MLGVQRLTACSSSETSHRTPVKNGVISCSSTRGIGQRVSQRDARVLRASQFSGRPLPKLSARIANGRKQVAVCQAAVSGPLRVMIAGAPAAGKGTQCARIVEKYGLVHICVGDMLRAEIKDQTEAGQKAKAFMDNGELVPNEIVVDMVKSRLKTNAALENGWLLDGYPRSLEQANAIEQENIKPDIFLLLDVPDDILVERVVGRRNDPETGEIYHLKYKPPPQEIVDRLVQRSDDTEEKVVNRLKTYHSNLGDITDVYKNVMVKVDGNQSMEAVFESIVAAIQNNVAVAS